MPGTRMRDPTSCSSSSKGALRIDFRDGTFVELGPMDTYLVPTGKRTGRRRAVAV